METKSQYKFTIDFLKREYLPLQKALDVVQKQMTDELHIDAIDQGGYVFFEFSRKAAEVFENIAVEYFYDDEGNWGDLLYFRIECENQLLTTEQEDHPEFNDAEELWMQLWNLVDDVIINHKILDKVKKILNEDEQRNRMRKQN